MADRTYVFTTGQQYEFEVIPGDMVYIVSANGAVKIKFDNETEWHERTQGQGISNRPYKKVTLYSESAQTVTFSFGFHRELNDTATVSEANASIIVPNTRTSSKQNIIASGSYNLAARADRKAAIIQYDPRNTNDSYIQLGTDGEILEKGQMVVEATTAAILIKNLDTSNAVDVLITELRYV